jgi:excisionase family DNA binding protein
MTDTLAEKTIAALAEALERAKLTPHTETVTHTVTVTNGHATGWSRERLWAVPADTRLTVREVAQVLGKSRDTVLTLLKNRRLPGGRINRRHSPVAAPPWTVRAADLRRFLGDK